MPHVIDVASLRRELSDAIHDIKTFETYILKMLEFEGIKISKD